MTANRKVGKVNENTTLIDITMMGVHGVTAVYLIEGGKKCLIDGGTSTEARYIIKDLEKLGAFPPDMIIVTHSHWDHTQAIPRMRKKAAKMGKKIEVIASQKAIPLLKDQSWNGVFAEAAYKNIEDVTPVNEGDIINLDGIRLKVFDVPGHTMDHIALFDEKNKNIFVGDSLGYKVSDAFMVPAFMPPFCNKEAFLTSINKLKSITYDTLCLAHIGYIFDEEAKTILEEAITAWDNWWGVFEENRDKLDDVASMIKILKQSFLKNLDTEQFGDALLQGVTHWLSLGYKTYKK